MSFCQVLVIIDVKPKDLGLPTEAYISVEEVHDVSHSLQAGDWLASSWVAFFGLLFMFNSTNLYLCDEKKVLVPASRLALSFESDFRNRKGPRNL